MKSLKCDTYLDIPMSVQVCPYCGGQLVASFDMWTEGDSGGWQCDTPILECKNEESIQNEDEYVDHYYMPYVYWIPASQTVETWVNQNYRFEVDS